MTDKVSQEKVSATPEAKAFLAEIVADHGPVLFHQSGGCCDGSSPMCYPRGDFMVGDRDVLLGEIDDTPVYISEAQYEAWKHTDLIIDVVPGRGGMFSLDNGRGKALPHALNDMRGSLCGLVCGDFTARQQRRRILTCLEVARLRLSDRGEQRPVRFHVEKRRSVQAVHAADEDDGTFDRDERGDGCSDRIGPDG